MNDESVQRRIRQLSAGDPDRNARLQSLVDSSEPSLDDWRVIRGHPLIDGRRLTDANLRTLYLHLTDGLIARLVSGGFDRLICLDKSARPVGWFVAALWDQLAPEFTGDGPQWAEQTRRRPRLTFLNIDRLQWRDVIDPEGIGSLDTDLLPDEVIEGLRRTFLIRPDERLAHADLWAAPTYLTGERILVADEVSVSGDTAAIATGILSRAFPDADFEPGHWMRPRLVRGADGNQRNNALPVWYRSDTHLGRGVADRNPAESLASPNWRVRQGAWFLSRPHRPASVDVPGYQLRTEIRRIAARTLVGAEVMVPSFERDLDEADARSEFFSGMTMRELRDWRERSGILLDL